jgi:hypothetical protein
MQTIVTTKVIEVTNALAALGVPLDVLRAAINAGEIARNECTLNDPPNGPGFFSWDKTLRGIKEGLIPEGWTREDYMIVRGDGLIAICVAAGDDATGNPDPNIKPKTKNIKGVVMAAAIRRNRNQMDLFDKILNKQIIENSPPREMQTWVLLRNRVGDEVACELSLPSWIAKDGRVVDWGFRIILPSVQIAPDPMRDQDYEAERIEVPVKPRTQIG